MHRKELNARNENNLQATPTAQDKLARRFLRGAGCAAIAVYSLGLISCSGADEPGTMAAAPPAEPLGQHTVAAAADGGTPLDTFWNDNVPGSFKDAFKVASQIAAAYSGASSIISAAMGIGSMLGIFESGGDGTSPYLRAQLETILNKLDENNRAILGLDYVERLRDTAERAAEARAASEQVRGYVIANRRAMPESLATPALLQSATAVSVLADGSYFLRTFGSDRSTDGEPTTTDGKVTEGEWKQVIADRIQNVDQNNTYTFDWRMAMPSLLQATAMRLNVLGGVYPDYVTSGRFRGELLDLRSRMFAQHIRMNTNIRCGFSLWAVGNQAGNFELKAICADIATGTTHIVSKRGVLESWGDYCDAAIWGDPLRRTPRNMNVSGTVNGPLAPQQNCPMPQIGAYLTNADVKARFMQRASSSAVFGDLLKNGLDDARVSLSRKMGSFEITQMEDRLYALAYNVPRPERADGTIRGPFAGACLDLDSTDIANAGGTMKRQIKFTQTPCSGANAWWSNSWYYKPLTGEIINTAFSVYNNKNWCIDVPLGSGRSGVHVWTWECTGADAQKWSYNAELGLLTNAAGKVLHSNGLFSSVFMTHWTVTSPNQRWGVASWK